MKEYICLDTKGNVLTTEQVKGRLDDLHVEKIKCEVKVQTAKRIVDGLSGINSPAMGLAVRKVREAHEAKSLVFDRIRGIENVISIMGGENWLSAKDFKYLEYFMKYTGVFESIEEGLFPTSYKTLCAEGDQEIQVRLIEIMGKLGRIAGIKQEENLDASNSDEQVD